VKKQNGSIIYAPTDIVRFYQSPFASWMDRRALDGDPDIIRDAKDPMSEIFFKRGNTHEEAYL